MARYRVLIEDMVVQQVKIEVDAGTPADARVVALELTSECGSEDWEVVQSTLDAIQVEEVEEVEA